MVCKREMKKILSIFVIVGLLAPFASFGAVTVNKKSAVTKKASVETQKTSGLASATSLLPAVISTVSGVMELKKATQALGADCSPTGSEISLINELVKEWARVGDTDASGAMSGFDSCYGDTYYSHIEQDGEKACATPFTDNNMIWKGYPRAESATVNKKTYSNVYDIFAKIPFGFDDYTKSEADQVKALIEKTERCAPNKISAKKRELWGGFLTNTISQVGSSAGVSGVGDVMQMATQFGAGGGGVSSVLGQFGGMATQMMDK